MHQPQASVDICTSRGDEARPQFSARSAGHLAVVVDERRRLRRLERDLHDGVQNELIALIVKLAVAGRDPRMPPVLADMLAGLEARAQSALDAVRSIVRGIYPPLLADFGLADALRAQAARAAIRVALIGSVPRSNEDAEEAIYFSCSEAIQNASKHAGPNARMTLWLHHRDRTITVLITDDGWGFDPAQPRNGGGLESIRSRIESLGGRLDVASQPGHGTVLTISLPWPASAGGSR